MKKSIQYYYLAVLAALILLPVLVFTLLRGHIDTNNYENRLLAEKPVLGQPINTQTAFPDVVTIENFPGYFDSWFNDHLPFRNQLLSFNGRLDYDVLKSTTSDVVIIGKEGWLFYKGAQANAEDPIGDYKGTNLFSDGQLERIANNMIVARDELRERGAEFVIFICPNKERVYSEYMPDAYGEPSQENRMQQVVDYLRSHTDIPVVSAYEDLMAYKLEHPEQQLYFKYDTHWNDVGAYIGTRTLNETLGFTQVPFEELTVEDYGMGNFDLARLLHLGQYLNRDGAYKLYGYTPHEITKTGDATGTEFHMSTDDTAPGWKLFVIGDSFSTMSLNYYACHYQYAYLNFYYNYQLSQLEEEQPSVVVYECVERYLGNMLNFSITDGIKSEAEPF